MAQQLREHGATSITLVAYLREQPDYLSSDWKQRIKAGLPTHTPDGLLARHMRNTFALDYAKKLSIIESALSSCIDTKTVVRIYDRKRFPGGTICRDFCEAAGIPWQNGYIIPADSNTSLSFNVAEAIRRMDNVPKPGTFLRGMLIRKATKLSSRYPDSPGTKLYSPDEILELQALHETGNRLVAQRYLGRECLFPTGAGDHLVWEPDEEAILATKQQLEDFLRHTPNLQKLWETEVFAQLNRKRKLFFRLWL